MIKIDNLAQFIEDAQEHFVDKYVFYNTKDHRVYVVDTIYDEDDTLDMFESNDDMVLVIVESFSQTMFESFFDLQEETISIKLYNTFRGKGKYRKIKDLLFRLNLIDNFYAYQKAYTEKIALKWCIDNNMPYEKK